MPNDSRLQQRIEQISSRLEQDRTADLSPLLGALNPAGIARLIEALPAEHRIALWRCVSTEQLASVLLNLHGKLRRTLARESDPALLVDSLGHLQADQLADIDDDLPAELLSAMVAAMDAQRRQRYALVKDYPDDSAGGLMNADATAVRADVSLNAVLRYLRQLHRRNDSLAEPFDSLMVVDRNNRLIGILPLSRLVALSPSTNVQTAMQENNVVITPLQSASEVARLFEDADLVSAPVVDDTGRLLGRITVDDVIDVLRAESDRQNFGRAGLQHHPDLFAPILPSSARRAVWLGINLATAFLAAWVIGLFEQSIEQLVALAVLMPVVASMGGAAGNQTLTLVTRAVALDQVGRHNLLRLTGQELLIGGLNGLFWALVVALIAWGWFGNGLLGLVFGVALLLAILIGAAVGALLPVMLRGLGIDPALAGGVVLTTATDAVGFLVFLGLASKILL